jgi:hypothetical protein
MRVLLTQGDVDDVSRVRALFVVGYNLCQIIMSELEFGELVFFSMNLKAREIAHVLCTF